MTQSNATLVASVGLATDIDWPSTLLLLAAGVLIGVIFRRRSRERPAPAITEQRGALVSGCVKVRALLDDPLLADILDGALRDAGVSVFDPTAQIKDATRHRIDHTVPAPDAADDGLVARTLTPGYLDGDRLLAPAEVVVHKWVRP